MLTLLRFIALAIRQPRMSYAALVLAREIVEEAENLTRLNRRNRRDSRPYDLDDTLRRLEILRRPDSL